MTSSNEQLAPVERCEHGVRWPHPCDECLDRDIPAGKSILDHPCFGLPGDPSGLSHRNSWPLSSDEHPYCARCGTEIEGENNRQKAGAPLHWEPRPLPNPRPVEQGEELVELIETRLLGVSPDDQDVILEDHDWRKIILALRQATANKAGGLWYRRWHEAQTKLAALRTPPAVEPDEGLVAVAYLIERLSGKGYGSPRSVVDAQKYDPTLEGFWIEGARERHRITPLYSTPSIRAQALDEAALQDWELPEDIASAIRSIGKAEWGATARKSAEDHAADVANSVRLTAEHFGQTEPQPMHGLYVEGTETVICHTGTSPNSAVHAQALTGAWNWLHDRALKGGQGV